jgi:hypothetical protein
MKNACLILLLTAGTSAHAMNLGDLRKSTDVEDRRTIDQSVPFDPGLVWSAEAEQPPVLLLPPIPDEAMKKRALLRAYELNGNSMCCGSIDVSHDPVVTGRVVITPETEFNVLDATADKASDPCGPHGMVQVPGQPKRCRRP